MMGRMSMDAIDVIKVVAQSLVDDSDSVRVKEAKLHPVIILEVSAAKEDVGKLVGKKGNTAQALRTILNCIGAKERKKYVLQILD